MHLVNKIFNKETIRTVWDEEQEKYFISVVDIVRVLADSSEPRKYWNWLKNKLRNEENFETSSITRQLKLKAQDGKYHMTDVVDIEGVFRIIESVPSKNAEPIKQWLAKLGSERIDETFDPSLTAQRAIDFYRSKGLDKNIEGTRQGGKIAGNARNDLEHQIGESVVTSDNDLNCEYVDGKEIEMK